MRSITKKWSQMQLWAFSSLLIPSFRNGSDRCVVQAYFGPMLQPLFLRSCGLSLRNTVGNENSDPLSLSPVPITPCTRICRYNANIFDGQVCIGCFRETYEIGSWDRLGPIEKYYALLDAADRLEQTVKESTTIDELATGTSRQELLRQAEYWKAAEAARKDEDARRSM